MEKTTRKVRARAPHWGPEVCHWLGKGLTGVAREADEMRAGLLRDWPGQGHG